MREQMRGRMQIDRDIAYIFVIDSSRKVLVDTFERGCPAELLGANSVSTGESYSVKPLDTAQGSVWDVAVPLRVGNGTVRVGISRNRLQATLRGINCFLVLLTIGTAALGSLAACWLTSAATHPIRQFAKDTEAIALGELQQQAPVAGCGEIATLAASFNTMSEALASSRHETDNVNYELVRRNRELTVLSAIATTVSRSLDLQGILNGALETIMELLKVTRGWVYLKDERTGCLALSACKGFLAASPQDDMATLPEKCIRCACRQAMDSGTPKFVHAGPICLHGDPEAVEREGLKCHVSVPLKNKEMVLGIMNLACAEDRDWPEQEIQLLSSIGHQIGMAVENARLYKELWGKEMAAQHLLGKLISAHEDERARIARELHDDAGQRLTALLLHLAGLEAMLPAGAEEAKRRLEELQALTASIVEEVRRLMRDLRPSLLDDLGLVPAISSFAETQLKHSGVKFTIDVQGVKKKLAPPVETALFRIFQEAITNIARHSVAKNAHIELWFKDSLVAARITDDGRGFDPVTSHTTWQTFGLLGIEERVAILEGTLQIVSQEGQGTQIHLEIPLSAVQR
jgi:signal transduction histidine kinase